MAIIKLAGKSLLNRKTTVLLTILSIAISVTLLLGVERVRTQAKESFANTISGTDIILGARTGPVQLLLYSVFRIGNATNNISWESYQEVANHRSVKWSVPMSLGDSHRGFRVLGTTDQYFTHYRYGSKQSLNFQKGEPFAGVFGAVIGSEVAKKLNYKVGDKIIVAHGAGATSFTKHDQYPFTITGILSPTATPVDRTVHVTLEGIEAIHVGWNQGAPSFSKQPVLTEEQAQALQPKVITAALIGVNSKIKLFGLQRYINNYTSEPLQGIIPGVALHELWKMMSVAEQALVVISVFVVVSGLLGMLTMLMASLNERRREMAILRALGARPKHIFLLLSAEAGILALVGAIVGVGMLYSILFIAQPIIESHYGLAIAINLLTAYEWQLLGLVCGAGIIIGAVPAIRAYRMSLSDGMTIRV